MGGAELSAAARARVPGRPCGGVRATTANSRSPIESKSDASAASAATSGSTSMPAVRARRMTLRAYSGAGGSRTSPKIPCSRPGSVALIASQFVSTSPADETSTSPKMCGWRRMSLAWLCSATSARSPAPRSSSSSDRKWTWKSTSPSSSRSLASSPAVGRVGELVGLLERVRDDRPLVPLAVPRALDPRQAPSGRRGRPSASVMSLRALRQGTSGPLGLVGRQAGTGWASWWWPSDLAFGAFLQSCVT